MGNYSGMSYDQLKNYIMSGDPAALDTAAKDWKAAATSADEVNATLRPKAAVVKPAYRGVDGAAFGENLDMLGSFSKQLNVDAQDAYEGMLNAASALKSAQQQAKPIIAKVEAAKGKEREKLEKLAARKLATIMDTLASAYQDTIDKKWHDPAPAPKSMPFGAPDAPDTNGTEYDGQGYNDQPPIEAQPLPWTDPSTGGYDPYEPTDSGGLQGGLAGGTTAAPSLPAGPVGAAPVAAATTAGAVSTPPLPLGGLAGAGSAPVAGGSPARPPSKQPSPAANRGGATAPMTGAGHGQSEDDEQGEHTWLTEDEMVWTTADSAPVVIGEQKGYR